MQVVRVNVQDENMEEHMAAVNKSIKALSNAFRFPKKKPRGTMRRKRREKRRLAWEKSK